MPRIRTIKPDFFRHEELQDLEADHPGNHVMLVFAGLWGHCDKDGRFPWNPRQLKLDILPFLDFDLGASLMLLWEAGLVKHYISDGKSYGFIPTFRDHQRISGKEAQEPAKYPDHNNNFTSPSPGNSGEAIEKQLGRQEGKGREGKGSSGVSGSSDEEPTTPAPSAHDVQDHDPPDDDMPELPVSLRREKPPDADGFEAAATDEKALYRYGKSVLGQNAGGLITKIRKLYPNDMRAAADIIRQAAEKENPREWVGAVLRGDDSARTPDHIAFPPDIYNAGLR